MGNPLRPTYDRLPPSIRSDALARSWCALACRSPPYPNRMLILNNCELEEQFTNEWEEVMSSVSSARRLDVVFHEPPGDGAGSWVWSDGSQYHLLVRSHDNVLLSIETSSYSEIEFHVFRGPISKLAEDMEGDDDHNILELSKTISPTFRRAMSAFIEESK